MIKSHFAADYDNLQIKLITLLLIVYRNLKKKM